MPVLGTLGHVIVNWDTKNIKKRKFLVWKLFNLPITQKPHDALSWNLDTIYKAYECMQNGVCGCPVTWPKFYSLKMGKKLTNLNRYIAVVTILMKNGLWFLSTLSTTFLLFVFVYPNLDTILLVFHLSSYFFFFFFFCRYLLLNCLPYARVIF